MAKAKLPESQFLWVLRVPITYESLKRYSEGYGSIIMLTPIIDSFTKPHNSGLWNERDA